MPAKIVNREAAEALVSQQVQKEIPQGPITSSVIISRQGESGKNGLRGRELFNLCKTNGCTDAISFDGGGSVFLVSNGKDIHATTRAVKNALILYRRKKKSDTEITEPSVPEIEPSDKPKDEEGTNTSSTGNDDQSGSGTVQTDSAIINC